MNGYLKIFIILFLFVIISFKTQAQSKQWTLEECITYAYENNLQLRRELLNKQKASLNFTQAKQNRYPALNGFYNHNLSAGRVVNIEEYEYVNQTFNDGNIGLEARVTIWDGLSQANLIEQRKYSLMAQEEWVEAFKNNMAINLAAGYLQILLDHELVEMAQSRYELTQQEIERTEILTQAGTVARGELLEINSQSQQEKAELITRKNNLQNAYLNLAQMLDLEFDSIKEFEIVIPDDVSIADGNVISPVDSIYRTAVASLPQVKSAEYLVKESEEAIQVAKAGYSPEVSLRALYYSRYTELATDPLTGSKDYPVFSQLDNNQYKQVTVAVSIPIFNKMTTRNNVALSKINRQDALLTLNQEKQQVLKNVQEAYTDALAALESFYAQQEAEKSTMEALKYAQQKFEAGMVSSVDLNIAKNNFAEAQSRVAQAKYEYIFKTKILDFYKGNQITLNL